MSALALPGERRPSKLCVETNEKTSINSIYLDLWPPTAVRLQGLTSYSSVSTRWHWGMFTNSRSDWWSPE